MGQTCDDENASFYFTGLQHHGNRLTQGPVARGGVFRSWVGSWRKGYAIYKYKCRRGKKRGGTKLRKDGVALVWWPSEK